MNTRLRSTGTALAAAVLIVGCTTATSVQPGPTTAPTTAPKPASATATTVPTPSPSALQGSIRVGLISPVTGPVAVDGELLRNGAKLAAEEINAAGGVLGARLELVIEDGQCKPDVSASAAQKLATADRVPVVIGAHCSPATAGAMPILERARIPLVSGLSSAPSLTAERHDWFFRMAPTELMTAQAAVPYYLEQSPFKSVAFLVLNDEWGRQAGEANARLLQEKGVKVVSTDYFAGGDSEFSPVLTKIKAAAPEAIFVAANSREAILISQQIQQLGLPQKLFGVGAFPTNTFIQGAGAAANGWTVISQYVPSIDTPANKKFVEAYMKAYNAPPDKYAVTGYDVVYVVADAIKRAGAADPARIREALETTNLDIVQGRLWFDQKHQGYTNVVISRNENGESKVLKVVPTAPS